jgi:hypothetical protein
VTAKSNFKLRANIFRPVFKLRANMFRFVPDVYKGVPQTTFRMNELWFKFCVTAEIFEKAFDGVLTEIWLKLFAIKATKECAFILLKISHNQRSSDFFCTYGF